MPTHTLENPYRGVNAHLHSIAQNPLEGSPTIWTSIHASHIVDIINSLNGSLPLNYIARAEQSLQIWTEDFTGIPLKPRSPQPDVSVFRTSISDSTIAEAIIDDIPVRVIPINPLLEREITIPSAVIYEVKDHEVAGKPVTRIELLSASNMQDGSGYYGYLENRGIAIQSGTSLIELDYLHQFGSPMPKIARYPYQQDSHAYIIAVTDRRPRHQEVMLAYLIDVDMLLPKRLTIPLAGEDSLAFDFDAVYQFTFKTGRWGLHLDYDELPRNFENYSALNQARIKAVMERAKTIAN